MASKQRESTQRSIRLHTDGADGTGYTQPTRRTKLTTARIEAFQCQAGKTQMFLWDSEVPHLAVRVTASGHKAYVFESKLRGRTIRKTIGSVLDWPLSSRAEMNEGVAQLGARERARELQRLIDQGLDPRDIEREQILRVCAAQQLQVVKQVEVRDAWLEYVEQRRSSWGAAHYRDHLQVIHEGGSSRKRSRELTKPAVMASLVDRKVSELSFEVLSAWAKQEMATRPARVRLALRLISGFVRWCADHPSLKNVVDEKGLRLKKIRQHLGEPAPRKVALQKQQLATWFRTVRAYENVVISAYLQFLLLTGARPNEPLSLQWQDLDLQWKTITIRDKVEGKRTIGLTPEVARLLNGLPRRVRADGRPNEWVFSSPSSSTGALVEPRIAHDRICEQAGLPKITLQGLRRSFASLSEWIDVPAGISAQIQGHKPSGVRERNYIERPIDLLRHHQTRIEAWMLEHAGIAAEQQIDAFR